MPGARRRRLAAVFVAGMLLGVAAQAQQQYTYWSDDAGPLRLYVFPPASAKPGGAGVLLFHGGGWNLGSAQWTYELAAHFAAEGLVAIAVDYRLSDATHTPLDALQDTCAAYRWVRSHAGELQVSPQRLAGFGESAGGQLVAAAATVGCEQPGGAPDALLLWSAAVDVSQMYWFIKQLQGRAAPAALSPLQHLTPAVPPTVIVHGEQDSITPFAGAEQFCARVRQFGKLCELYGYPGLGHLLSKRLDAQDKLFDIDPATTADGRGHMDQFLRRLGYIQP